MGRDDRGGYAVSIRLSDSGVVYEQDEALDKAEGKLREGADAGVQAVDNTADAADDKVEKVSKQSGKVSDESKGLVKGAARQGAEGIKQAGSGAASATESAGQQASEGARAVKEGAGKAASQTGRNEE